jgi:hypothetical protein
MDKTSTLKKHNNHFNTKNTETKKDNTNEYACEPSAGIINSILNYSKSLIVSESKTINQIAIVLS